MKPNAEPRKWLPPCADPLVADAPLEFHGGPGYERDGDYPPVTADLSTNINPYTPDEAVRQAVARAPIDAYPDPAASKARALLARAWALDSERILLGPGASELLYRVARCWICPGDPVVACGPTFGEYRRAVHVQGGEYHEIRGSAPDFALPLARFSDAVGRLRPPVAFLCTPNNPTGEALPDDRVADLACRMPAGTLLVIDESYRSFAAGHLAPPHLPGDDRVLHLRSFTKDLGVPGLRLAAAIAPPAILEPLIRAAPPWSVSSVAEAALCAALTAPALARLKHGLARLAARRQGLSAAVARRGWQPRPSSTGFILSAVSDAAGTTHALRIRGVRVRHAASFGLPGHIRVAVRRRDEEDRFLAALDDIADLDDIAAPTANAGGPS
ncbi:MAG: histidinol-phosphate aminotransferase family protein [Gemmatimonadetes bacterium]|nr:histidinol-phosphate transaminase [Gemmatimonadota bacterium]MYA44725.1 histidinol-phosphate aminotransferase family protein [Gemmatimonadota bacterium]MYE93372.1 histidinol-phosphate aminotransferase family protein [Gemmatimonadota bacterium]MYJ10246.1 histidinol-phosphate aminotransferase family protein [Gemmatimonadota bacterium]